MGVWGKSPFVHSMCLGTEFLKWETWRETYNYKARAHVALNSKLLMFVLIIGCSLGYVYMDISGSHIIVFFTLQEAALILKQSYVNCM